MGFYAERVFPRLMGLAEGDALTALRARAVAPASGRVLEIGFGTGSTLPHYGPAVTRLDVVEPSAGMTQRASRRIAGAAFPVAVHQGEGEALPFGDGVFDTAVSVFTLCSVRDLAGVLGEIRRVLRPGGALLFAEHVASERKRVRRMQAALNPLQRRIACGCELDRDTGAAMAAAGFRVEAERVFPAPVASKLVPVIVGSATAPPDCSSPAPAS